MSKKDSMIKILYFLMGFFLIFAVVTVVITYRIDQETTAIAEGVDVADYNAMQNVFADTVSGLSRMFLAAIIGIVLSLLALSVITVVSVRRNVRIKKELTDQAEQQKAEIEALNRELDIARTYISTSQMQPHFLYNALASIREIILDDPQYASDLVCDFTTHLRACVRSMSADTFIPFSQELENIKAYVNIEKMRFGDRMAVTYDIEEDSFSVLPLSIQPLVENSIRHGLYNLKQAGHILVSSKRVGDQYVICVKDDGIGFDYEMIKEEVKAGKRDSTGLQNLIFRLEKLLGATVGIDSNPGCGAEVKVCIPVRESSEIQQ